METEKKPKNEKKAQAKSIPGKIAGFSARWFFLAVMIASAAYAALLWRKYILNADWSDEKKSAYISEQSVLTFDEAKYKKALEIRNSRRSNLESGEKFTGRDIFFPE